MVSLFPSRAVAISLFGFEIHWYGLLYLLGFLIAAALLPRLQRYRQLSLSRDAWLSLLSWSVIGVIVGGRLGYVLFYEPTHFLRHPSEIVAVWEGGMSFHGGLLGVSIVLLFFARAQSISLLLLLDIIVVPVAIGLALGRLGNFINQELYGTITLLPWGISIPGVEGMRHPTQLYAVGKDLIIALVCFVHLRLTKSKSYLIGCTGAAFLVLYSIGRFSLEFLREQQYPLTEIFALPLTRGQLLTVPVFLVGIGICLKNRIARWKRKV